MKDLSYLLMLDSSKESRAAAALSWRLARETGASVVAQHVVDSAAVWRFLSFETTGFVGSGVFMEARERMISVLHSIADALVLSYECLAEGSGVKPYTVIDEGDLVMETARRAKEHDLIICGERPMPVEHPQFLERLTQVCPCPILVVRGPYRSSSKLQIIATKNMPDSSINSNLYPISTALGLPVEVQVDEALADGEGTAPMQAWFSALDVRSLRRGTLNEALNGEHEDVLLIVPTSSLADSKLTRLLKIVKRCIVQGDPGNNPRAYDLDEREDEEMGSLRVS